MGHRAKVSEKAQLLTEGLCGMAMDQFALLELLEMLKAADVDGRIRVEAQSVYQVLIDAEAAEEIGAGRWERTDARLVVRNGSRVRVLSTTAGDRGVADPDVAGGLVFPSLL